MTSDKEDKIENILVIQNVPKDHPFAEIAAAMEKHASKGHMCYQKYTCAGCGQRLGMNEPNVLYRTGKCDHCGHVTDIEAQGCNYLLEMHGPATVDEFIKRARS
jgi:DNA-directed RNA polymerase subunit RPC12/RpoP